MILNNCLLIIGLILAIFHVSEAYRLRNMKLQMSSKYLGKDPVFVAGGSSGVGLELIKRLSGLGTPVHVLVRRKDAEVYLKTLPGVKVSFGDALDPEAVQKSMRGCVAAVTTLGGQPAAGQVERVDYAGNSNVIEQAGILGVERIVLVTSVGCGSSISAIPRHIYLALEGSLEAKTRAERDLKMYTNLDWTIVRPGGLKSDSRTGKSILTEDSMASGSITREDCADLLVKVLDSGGQCTRREFTAVDPTLSDPEYTFKPFKF
jgi:nucleoside-diphosphate-sugar epimerase